MVMVIKLFVLNVADLPVMLLVAGSMTANSLRNALLQTVLTNIAPARHRAAFLSVMTAFQQCGAALGSSGVALFLRQAQGPAILGMDPVGWAAVALAATLTPLVLILNRLRAASET